MTNKFFAMLGMAMRAGKVSSGEFIVKKSIKSGRARLVIIASDASDTTKKSIINSCDFYKVKNITTSTMEELGSCIGKAPRAVVAIEDNNFAKAVMDKSIS